MGKNKVILISVDGMRPDGFLACGNPFAEEMMQRAFYTLDGQTVMPSMTLPCHVSLFHSVTPSAMASAPTNIRPWYGRWMACLSSCAGTRRSVSCITAGSRCGI